VRNVRLSNLLISSCNVFGLISSSCVREGEGDTDARRARNGADVMNLSLYKCLSKFGENPPISA